MSFEGALGTIGHRLPPPRHGPALVASGSPALKAVLHACVQLGRASRPRPLRPARCCGDEMSVHSPVPHGSGHRWRFTGLAAHSDQMAQGTQEQRHCSTGAVLTRACPGQSPGSGDAACFARLATAHRQPRGLRRLERTHRGYLVVSLLFHSLFLSLRSAPLASVAVVVVRVGYAGLRSPVSLLFSVLLGRSVAAHACLSLRPGPRRRGGSSLASTTSESFHAQLRRSPRARRCVLW